MPKPTKLPRMGDIKRELSRSQNRVYDLALTMVEAKARAILRAHPNLDEFVMAMGGWVFTRKNEHNGGYISTVYREHIPVYAKPFSRMMDKFDDLELKVTGEPMRFTSHGPVVKTWGVCDGMDGATIADKYAEPR